MIDTPRRQLRVKSAQTSVHLISFLLFSFQCAHGMIIQKVEIKVGCIVFLLLCIRILQGARILTLAMQSFDGIRDTEFTFDTFCFKQGSLNLTVTGIPTTPDSNGNKV
jgi:hypothetical protein